MIGRGRADAAETLAEGAAIPPSKAQPSASTDGSAPRPTGVNWPPVTASGTASWRLRIRVNGPGQKVAAVFAPLREFPCPAFRWSAAGRCTISSGGRQDAPWPRRFLRRRPDSRRRRREAIDRLGGNGNQVPARSSSTARAICAPFCPGPSTGSGRTGRSSPHRGCRLPPALRAPRPDLGGIVADHREVAILRPGRAWCLP